MALIEETIQDDFREIQVAKILRLTKSDKESNSRMGKWDAVDERGWPYELKTSGKKNIPFNRKVTDVTIERKSGLHWIFTTGKKFKDQEYIIHEMYYLPPSKMQIYLDGIMAQINSGFEFFDSYIDPVKIAAMSDEDKLRFERQRRNAASMNDPHVKWSFVAANGYQILEPYDVNLRRIQEELAVGKDIATGPKVEDILF